MKPILFSDDQTPEERSHQPQSASGNPLPNIFQGRTVVNNDPASFPDWDIVPPSQFINPRLKQQ